jgi:hypothetical protein
MYFTAIDIAQSLLSVLLYIPLLLLPGLAIGAFAERNAVRPVSADEYLAEGLVLGFAVLPLLDSMAVRFATVPAALLLNLLLGGAGLALLLRRGVPRFGAAAPAVLAIWTALVLLLSVDIDWQDKLFQSTPVLDMVKHAATVRAILESGAPPVDPFFAREGASGYYYFFYTLPALAVRLGFGFVEPRTAVIGLMVWTGIGLFALATLTMRRAGLAGAASARRISLVLVALLFTTGLDVAPVISSALNSGTWVESLEWWNDQITSWVASMVWVPHHVAGLIAAWAGLMLLAEEAGRLENTSERASPARLAVAALCLASALGLSVWVTLGAAAAAAAWVVLLAIERRWRAVGAAALVGLGALAAAGPAIADLLANRSYGTFPVALTIRSFHVWSVAVPPGAINMLGRLVLLPLNYAIEFGIFLVGTLAFWAEARRAELGRNETARMLTVTAVAGLLLATFTRSVIIGNDLGWRVILFPQFAALIWTAHVIATGSLRVAHAPGTEAPSGQMRWLGRPTLAGWLLILGYLGIAYDVVALRTIRGQVFTGIDPQVTRELRTGYGWLNAHLPGDAVLQHNPVPARVYDFGLHSRHRVGVADREAELFGASREAVYARVRQLGPIFETALPASEVRAAASSNGVDYLVVTAQDPIWREAGSWLWSTPPVYAAERLRVIRVADLPTS